MDGLSKTKFWGCVSRGTQDLSRGFNAPFFTLLYLGIIGIEVNLWLLRLQEVTMHRKLYI